MIAVLTGDIVNSRKVAPAIWTERLRKVLSNFGREEKDWEVYRGDSFQVKCEAEKGFIAAMTVKSVIRQVKRLDVRIGMGIGDSGPATDGISHSFGEAFQYSGKCFDSLGKRKLGIITGYGEVDRNLNLVLDLISLSIDQWSVREAQMVHQALEKPNIKQEDLAAVLNTSQANVSSTLKRAAFDEVMRVNSYYIEEISGICHPS